MKLVIDRDIPFINGLFEPFATVLYYKGAEITNNIIKDTDGLIIRTRTKCNEALLAGTKVKFIATATIGTDHIDLNYCAEHGITVKNAAGCNSSAVMQYVFTALYALINKGNADYPSTIGVIGVGNVGSKVAALGEYLGFKVLRNDPPKEALGQEGVKYCSLEYLLKNSDIITLHVPLLEITRGMVNSSFFECAKKGAVLINTSRGEVVDEAALLKYRGSLRSLVLDVWNNEPNINPKLLEVTDIATPHIAGYSVEGKANGTLMAVEATARYFKIEQLYGYTLPVELFDRAKTPVLALKGEKSSEIYNQLINIFPIFSLDNLLRENISEFEKIRSNYKLRREFNVYQDR